MVQDEVDLEAGGEAGGDGDMEGSDDSAERQSSYVSGPLTAVGDDDGGDIGSGVDDSSETKAD